MTIYLVAPHPTLPLVPEKLGRLEDLQVPCRRRPGLLEHTGDLAGGHRAALEVHREQDATTHGVGERREHCLVGIPLIAMFLLRHTYYLAQRLNIGKATVGAPWCVGADRVWAHSSACDSCEVMN